MKLGKHISPSIGKRQEVRIWLLGQPVQQNGRQLTMRDLADGLGISPSTLCKHLDKPTIPVVHHKILCDKFGVPECLLPTPKDLPPGPRPKNTNSSE